MSRSRLVLKRAGQALAVLTALGSGTGVGLVYWLTTASGNRALRRLVERQVDGMLTEGDFSLGGLHTNLFDGLALRDLSLTDGQGQVLVAADRVAVDWKLGGLLQRKLRLGRVRLDSPQVDLRSGGGGRLAILEILGVEPAPQSDAPPTAWQGLGGQVQVDALELRNGRLAWQGGELDELRLDGTARVDDRLVQVDDLDLSGRIRGPVDGRLRARLSARLDEGDLVLSPSTLSYEQLSLGLEGTVARIETAPDLDLRLVGHDLPAEDLSRLTGVEQVPAVDPSLSLTLRGPLDDLVARIEVDTDSAGSLQADLGADLQAERPGWWARLDAQQLDLQAIAPTKLESELRLGVVHADVAGSGLSWPDGLATAVELRVEDAAISGEELKRVEALAVVGAGQVELLQLSVEHAAGTVQGRAWVGLDAQRAELSLDARLPRLRALSELTGQPLGGSARWRPDTTLSWSDGVSVVASGPLTVDELSLKGMELSHGAGPLQLRFRDGGLDLDGELSSTRLDGGAWAVNRSKVGYQVAWAKPTGLTVDARFDLDGLSTPKAAARATGARGTASVRVPAGGELALDAGMMVDGLRLVPDGPRAGGPVSLTMQGDALSAELDLSVPGQEPLLSASVDGSLGEQSTWTIHKLRAEPLPGLVWTADGDVVIELGPDGLRSASGRLAGSGGSLELATQEQGRVIQLDGRALDLARLAELDSLLPAQPDGGGAEGTTVALDEEGGTEVPPLAGMARLSLHAERGGDGSLATVAGTVDVDGLSLSSKLIDVDLHLETDGPITLPRFSLDLAGAQGRFLRARGSVPLDLDAGFLDCGSPVDLQVVLLPGQLGALRAHLPSLPEQRAYLSANLLARGQACDPTLDLSAAAEAPLGLEGQLVRVDLSMERTPDGLSTEAFVEQGFERRVQLRGTAATALQELVDRLATGESVDDELLGRMVSDFNLALVPLGLPLTSLGAFVSLPPGISGKVAGGMTLSGSLQAPRIQGALQITEGQLGMVPVQSGLLTVLLEGEAYGADLQLSFAPLASEAELDPAPQRSLVIRSKLPLAPGRSLAEVKASEGFELFADGQLPLALLEGVVPGVSEAEGVAQLSARIEGSLDEPSIDGSLALEQGALTYLPLGLRYEGIGFLVDGSDKQVVVQDLAMTNRKRWSLGRLGSGQRTLTGSASVMLEDFKPTRVRGGLDLERFWITAELDRSLALNGSASVDGDWPHLSVSGDLEVAEAAMDFGEEFFGGGSSLAVAPMIRIVRPAYGELVRSEERAPPLWRSFDLDVRIDLLRNLHLSAEVPLKTDYGQQIATLATVSLDADLAGEVALSQSGGALSLRGEVETVRGIAQLVGKEFDVAGGTINFLGSGYANPLVDITAVHETSKGDVDAHVRGLVSDLSIDLSSDEYPDQLDVMSLLLVGMPASEVDPGQGPDMQRLMTAALASFGSGQLEQLVGTSFVDEFEVDSEALRLGKAVSDKLFLRLEQDWNPQDDQGNRTQVTLEYLITRRLYAEFVTGDRGASSARLYWRWRF